MSRADSTRHLFQGQHFAQKDTILVTAQYRLGSLGYLSTGQRDAAGNLGLFDLHTAMVWVSTSISLVSLYGNFCICFVNHYFCLDKRIH